MDVRGLITEVSLRRAIWDAKDKDYHNRVVLDELWKDIAEIIGCPVFEIKKKWKNLRVQFTAEYKKVTKNETRSSWLYYDQLLFIRFQLGSYNGRRVFPNGKTISELRVENTEAQISDIDTLAECIETSNDEFQLIEQKASIKRIADSYDASNYNFHSIQPVPPKKIKRKDDEADPLLGNEDRATTIVRKTVEERDSDDLLFFKSLLGFMKNFTPMRRLCVREKMQKVIMDELSASEEAS